MRTVFVSVWCALVGSVVGGGVGLALVSEEKAKATQPPEKVVYLDPPPGPPDLGVALGELPEALVADRLPVPPILAVRDGCYRGKYHFNADWFTFDIPVWEKVLAPYKGKPGVRYLEVGIFEGRSALWMMENVLTDPTSVYVGIDIFDGDLKDRWFANLKASGSERRATTIIGPSQVELRAFAPASFDIVYIDGDHTHAGVLEDCVLSWRLVKPGGMLILDDYRMTSGLPVKERPKQAIDVFMRMIGTDHFEVVHNDYQLVLRRKAG